MILARHLFAAALVLSAPMVTAAQSPPAATPAAPAIEKGSTVHLEYTLKDDAGAVLDTNKGQAPLTYTQGEEQILPGLEKELTGLHKGDEKKVTVKPEDGYGALDPSAQTEVPKEMLPSSALTVGTQLMARSAAGEARPVRVKEIKEQTVILDLNHPLAGKTLLFEVKVLGIDPPRTPEPTPAEPKPLEPTPTK
jgi:FKBP-type peptidyl-prolyl cis-trans isomerase SlyD